MKDRRGDMSETLKLHAFSSKLYTFYAKTPHLKLCLHVPNTDLPLASGGGEKAEGVMLSTAAGSPPRSHW